MVDFNHPLAVQIRKDIVRALNDFNMIEDGDKVMVCVSGGKDSSVLLALFTEIVRRSERKFTVEAALLDQKQPGFQVDAYRKWIHDLGVPFHLIEKDTYSIVKEKITEGATYCSLCARLRRAILYDFASNNGFTKMALGHHKNDVNNTFLLNLFFTGKISAMPAKLKSDDGRNILLRPLIYVDEADIEALASDWQIPIMPCNLCGSQDGLKRKRMAKLISELEKEIPDVSQSMLTAMGNIKPSQMLDHQLWDFKGLSSDK